MLSIKILISWLKKYLKEKYISHNRSKNKKKEISEINTISNSNDNDNHNDVDNTKHIKTKKYFLILLFKYVIKGLAVIIYKLIKKCMLRIKHHTSSYNLYNSYYGKIIINKLYDSLFNAWITESLHNHHDLNFILKRLNSSKGSLSNVNPIDQFYKELFNYTKNREKNIPLYKNDDEKRMYILYLTVWGRKYAEKMINYLIPSLLSKNNIPAFSMKYKLCFFIDIDELSYLYIRNSNVMRSLKKHADINYNIIPNNILIHMHNALNTWLIKFVLDAKMQLPSWKYYLMGCLDTLALLTAQKNKALISFLMPDLVFFDGAFVNLIRKMEQRKTIIALATTFRTSFSKVKPILDHKKIGKFHLSISNEELTQLIVENMHKSAQARIVSSANNYFSLTPQMIFSYEKEIVIRSTHYHPFLVDFSLIKKNIPLNYLPIDTLLLTNIVDYSKSLDQQIWASNDSSYVGVMELSDDDVEPVNFCKFTRDYIKTIIKEYTKKEKWSKAHLFLLKNRFVLKVQDINPNVFSDLCDRDLINTEK